jgi:hypothetical protein
MARSQERMREVYRYNKDSSDFQGPPADPDYVRDWPRTWPAGSNPPLDP